MRIQDPLSRLRLLYPTVTWLEPESKTIRRLQLGYKVALAFLVLLLPFPIGLLVRLVEFENLTSVKLIQIGTASLLLLTVLANIWLDFRELNNRIGSDGEFVYFADFRGKVWYGRPQDTVPGYFRMAGGPVLVLIRDKYHRPLYRTEDLQFFLSAASHVGRADFLGMKRLRYLQQHGYPMIAIRVALYLTPILLGVTVLVTLLSQRFSGL